ncbi:hypothetical protein C1646_773758 [Rhizophagus diaphanus]|nr:hypothetical protein C1646_773758 [Rhizophagus diaphanus] [Rhizophagus sp. MUCL 43196]
MGQFAESVTYDLFWRYLGLPFTLSQQQSQNFSQFEIEQIEQVRMDEGEENGDCDQDPFNKKSGNKWGHDEIKVLLNYIQENYSAWSKGNKSKFYNEMTKSKLATLIKKYESIKKHNDQTANREIGMFEEEAVEIKKEDKKQKQKPKNNVKIIATAIVEMSQVRERIWKKKKMELEKERIEVEKERWAYKRERLRMEFELRMNELDLKLQKRD